MNFKTEKTAQKRIASSSRDKRTKSWHPNLYRQVANTIRGWISDFEIKQYHLRRILNCGPEAMSRKVNQKSRMDLVEFALIADYISMGDREVYRKLVLEMFESILHQHSSDQESPPSPEYFPGESRSSSELEHQRRTGDLPHSGLNL